MLLRHATALCLLAASLAAPVARAEPDVPPSNQEGKEAPPEAIELYLRGREHYRAGRYRAAITDLKAALRLDPGSPNLMYNVARVSELLGNLDEAIDYYRRYLKSLPGSETEERDRIRETLQRLEGARTQVRARAAEDTSDLRAPSRATRIDAVLAADTWFWISAGTGVALLAGGAVAGVLALDRENRVADYVAGDSRDGDLEGRDDLIRAADSLALTSDVLLVAGAVLTTTAAFLLFARDPEGDAQRERAAVVRPSTRGATLRVAF